MRFGRVPRTRCRSGGRAALPHAAVGLLGVAVAAGLVAWSGGARGAAGQGPSSSSCTTGGCHVDRQEPAHLHRPVAAGACSICHRPSSAERHEFKLARQGSALCTTCHVEIAPTGNVHAELGPGGCLVCHDAHGTGNRFMLSAPRVVEACESCHPDILTGRNDRHLAVASRPCTLCHDPHGSDPPAWPSDDQALCLRCHATVRTELETRPYLHAPAEPGHCDSCHDGHGSDRVAKLREEVPGLCYECHGAIRETVETAEHPHSVASGPRGCLVCHEPHASALGLGLRADPFTLCGTCHAEDVDTADGEVIPAVTPELEGRFLHGPVGQRDCGACHDSHGSDHFRLLVDDYPAEFYTSFAVEKYGLCFGCHPPRGMLMPQTTELTAFRDGNVNLHYVHVVKPENGRTCRACHATHGSDAPKHMREWVQFGEWKLPIAFEPTATGGRCTSGCHVPRSYDREVPVLGRDAR
jgi:predicted CXXCH cytochrome family protein